MQEEKGEHPVTGSFLICTLHSMLIRQNNILQGGLVARMGVKKNT